MGDPAPAPAPALSKINPALVTPEAIRSFVTRMHSTDIGTASLNAAGVVDYFFTKDIELRYSNHPPAYGRDVAVQFFTMQFDNLDKVVHDCPVLDWIPAEQKMYQPANVEYLVKGDDEATQMIKVFAIACFYVREDEGRLKVWKAEIALDATKVEERMREKGLI